MTEGDSKMTEVELVGMVPAPLARWDVRGFPPLTPLRPMSSQVLQCYCYGEEVVRRFDSEESCRRRRRQ